MDNNALFGVDANAPTVVITDDTSGTATGPVTYTFTFSEEITNFVLADINITNGTAGTLTATGDAKVYTLEITPNANSTDQIFVTISGNKFDDLAGNSNTAEAFNGPQEVNTLSSITFDLSDGTSTNGGGTFNSVTDYDIVISAAVAPAAVQGTEIWTGWDQLQTSDGISFDANGAEGIDGNGKLIAANFIEATDSIALDADDYWIYDTVNDDLYYDADANGAGAAVLVVNFDADIDLTDYYLGFTGLHAKHLV